MEYLESGNILFVFKFSKIKSKDANSDEPIIMYGLIEKKKKNPDKNVQKFFLKTTPILENFIQIYQNEDFTDINLFQPFKDTIREYFF